MTNELVRAVESLCNKARAEQADDSGVPDECITVTVADLRDAVSNAAVAEVVEAVLDVLAQRRGTDYKVHVSAANLPSLRAELAGTIRRHPGLRFSAQITVPNKPKTPLHSFRVSNELWERAKQRAEERGESLSEAIRRFLERYVR